MSDNSWCKLNYNFNKINDPLIAPVALQWNKIKIIYEGPINPFQQKILKDINNNYVPNDKLSNDNSMPSSELETFINEKEEVD